MQTINAISNLPDMAGFDEIMAVLRSVKIEKPLSVSCFDLMKDYAGR